MLNYRKLENGIEILGFKPGKEVTNLVIPNKINDFLVISIGQRAFINSQLESLVIPDSIIEIGEGAFENNQLKSLIIPDSVTTISYRSFNDNKLESLTLGNSVTTIDMFAFANNQLTEVSIPYFVEEINEGAFFNNKIKNFKILQNSKLSDEIDFEEVLRGNNRQIKITMETRKPGSGKIKENDYDYER